MTVPIVADGERRLRRSPEFQAHLRELRASIRARHAEELAEAGTLRRLVLRWRIVAEFRRESRRLAPPVDSLYISHVHKESQ